MARRLVVILGILGTLTGPLDAAPTPAERCAAAKVKAAGKTAVAKLKCHQKAIAKNRAVDLGCLARADLRFEATLAKAEANGGCATAGDAPRVEAMVDGCVSELVGSQVPVPGTTTTTTTIRAPTTATTVSSTTTTVSVPTSAPGGSSMTATTGSTTSATVETSTSTSSSASTTFTTSSTTTTTVAVVTPCGGISPDCGGTCPAGLVCVGMTGEFCACR